MRGECSDRHGRLARLHVQAQAREERRWQQWKDAYDARTPDAHLCRFKERWEEANFLRWTLACRVPC